MIQPSSSKSRTEVDQRCGRERFLSTIYGGHGIEPVIEPLDLVLGNAVHHPLAANWKDPREAGMEAEEIMRQWVRAYKIQEPVRTEYPLLAHALVYGWLTRVLPDLLQDFEIVSFELKGEFVDPLTGVKWRARPDLVLRRLRDDTYWYWEFKTTSLDPSDFARIWDRKVQLHLGIRAMAETHGLEIEGVVVQGFHKGSKYKGSLRSRLIGGYRRLPPPGVGKPVFRTSHARGFEWFLASEYPGGVDAWVDSLPYEIIAEAFPRTAPIAPKPAYLAEFLEGQGAREVEIAEAVEEIEETADYPDWTPEAKEQRINRIINTTFRKNDSACENPISHTRCQFYEVCWNPVVGRDPVGSGLYQLRVYRESPGGLE